MNELSVPRIRALIAEDEALMSERLQQALLQVWPELDIVAVVADGESALEAFERMQPDLVFLDIRMPGRNGLDVAAELCERAEIVFITAYDEHALAAFDKGAADYLLKPVEPERLRQTVARVKKRLSQRSGVPGAAADLRQMLAGLVGQLGAAPERLKWLRASVGNQVRLIAVDDVLFFQSDTKYTRVVLADSEALVRIPLKEILDGLDPEQFWQIHRGVVVNAASIRTAVREGPEKLTVHLKGRTETLPVSRPFFHLFRQN